jgi:hypothetical protein
VHLEARAFQSAGEFLQCASPAPAQTKYVDDRETNMRSASLSSKQVPVSKQVLAATFLTA